MDTNNPALRDSCPFVVVLNCDGLAVPAAAAVEATAAMEATAPTPTVEATAATGANGPAAGTKATCVTGHGEGSPHGP